MAFSAEKIKLKHIVHVVLLTAVIAVGGHTAFSTLKQVHAEDIDPSKITKDRLEEHYGASIKAQLAGEKEAMAFFQKHLHKDYEGVMHVSSRIGNSPVQKETSVLTKFEYLRDTKKVYDISTLEELKSGIVSYEIFEDGRSVKLKDRTYVMANVPMEISKDKTETFNLRQFISCDNLYVLSEKNVLLLKSSTCEVEGQMNKSPNY